jgi:hypothetical protein
LTNDALGNLSFQSQESHIKYLARAGNQTQKPYRENLSQNATRQGYAFILEGRWALDRLDELTMRWLSKVAKRKRVGVADVIYDVIESFVAKCEAEADLERKIIKFRRRKRDFV